jgi:hypothetical protein
MTNNTQSDQRVQQELASIPKNGQGDLILTSELVADLSAESRLTIVLNAGARHQLVAQNQACDDLVAKHYNDIHPSKGGLNYDPYARYAKGCPTLLRAAERHRTYIESKKRAREAAVAPPEDAHEKEMSFRFHLPSEQS